MTTWFGKAMLQGQGVSFGEHLILKGLPIIKRFPGSSITIGDHVMMISYSSETALAVNHPVKVETLSPVAAILIGSDTGISGGSICAQIRVEIGAGCLLGANVTISDTDFHPIAAENRRYASDNIRAAPVHIGANVFLGSNAFILKGVTVGDNSIIGAGSVVTRNIPENAIAAGNPCRVLRMLRDDELPSSAR